jgi:hypothetical protein
MDPVAPTSCLDDPTESRIVGAPPLRCDCVCKRSPQAVSRFEIGCPEQSEDRFDRLELVGRAEAHDGWPGAVCVVVECLDFDDPVTNRIPQRVDRHPAQIELVANQARLVPPLKNVADARALSIQPLREAARRTLHQLRHPTLSAAHEPVGVVHVERPGEALGLAYAELRREPGAQIERVPSVCEQAPAIDSANANVMDRAGEIETRATRHVANPDGSIGGEAVKWPRSPANRP